MGDQRRRRSWRNIAALPRLRGHVRRLRREGRSRRSLHGPIVVLPPMTAAATARIMVPGHARAERVHLAAAFSASSSSSSARPAVIVYRAGQSPRARGSRGRRPPPPPPPPRPPIAEQRQKQRPGGLHAPGSIPDGLSPRRTRATAAKDFVDGGARCPPPRRWARGAGSATEEAETGGVKRLLQSPLAVRVGAQLPIR